MVRNLKMLGTITAAHLGLTAAEGANDMNAMNQMPPMMPGAPGQNMPKLFQAEKENLALVTHDWICDDVEERVLALYGLAY